MRRKYAMPLGVFVTLVVSAGVARAEPPYLRVVDERVDIPVDRAVGDLLVLGGSLELDGVVRGHVFAVDLSEITQAFGKNVTVLQGDALDLDNDALASEGPYDLVLSDMAPRTSGSKIQDQARSAELFMRALAVAVALGAPGSHFVGKLFMSAEFTAARQAVRDHFESEKTIRPSGTRQQSSEVFLVGVGLRR